MAHKSLIQWVNTFNTSSTSGEPTWYYWDTTNLPVANDYFPRSIEKQIDEAFNKLWANRSNPIIKDDAKLPKTNIYEDESGLVIQAFVPFVQPDGDELKVIVDPTTNSIKIEVEAHQPKEKREYYLNEVSRTSFKRSFAIDKKFDTDIATCDHKDGILTIKVPFEDGSKKHTIFEITND